MRLWSGCAAVLLVTAGGVVPTAQGGQDDNELSQARETLAKWVETRKTIATEKRKWALAKEMLQARIDAVKQEIETLEAKTGETGKSIAELDTKRTELVAKNEKLIAASKALRDAIVPLETHMKKVLTRLPAPIGEHVSLLARSIPRDPTKTETKLGERYRNVVGILNEIDKFNRKITMTSEVQKLPDGTSAEVTALYIGLGQAYYVTPKGDAAGIGLPPSSDGGDEGWVWTPANEAAKAIKKAIAVFENKQVAEFVHLPVRIK